MAHPVNPTNPASSGPVSSSKTGKVYLVGAGPGDADLLTLRAARILGTADVVLTDNLVSSDVLRFVNPAAEVIKVGKRAGCHSTSQTFIHRRMADLARAGKCVVRLKGGDPFVFGRGGEELALLRRAGVAVEVVSGVTAGIAVPATLGIPVTHRGYCHSVAFVTGHCGGDEQPNWRALAQSGATLVIYMGMSSLPAITQKLIKAGLPPELPAAAIQHGTLPWQRSVVTTLAQLPAAVKAQRLGSPGIVVVGRVVSMAQPAQQGAREAVGKVLYK